MTITDDSYKNYNAIRDVLSDIWPDKKQWTTDEVDFYISKLPRNTQLMGVMWGWSDTEFRDQLYDFLLKNHLHLNPNEIVSKNEN